MCHCALSAGRRRSRSIRRGSAGSRAAINGVHCARVVVVSPRSSAAWPRKKRAPNWSGSRFTAWRKAASAFRRLIELEPGDARAWARLGECLVRADDGRIGGDAEAAFREAVRLDPDQLGARFFLGQAAFERGDAAATRAQWTPLIAALDPADPRRQDLERRLPRAE